jgi:RNA polymerase sigma-70 factor (ECF subfamily)
LANDYRDAAWLERERALIARARDGDRQAFGELYRALAPDLYRQVLLPRLSDPAAAEDALAETFAAAFRRLDGYRDQGRSLFFWLARIAANQAIDQHRRRGRKRRALDGLRRLCRPLAQPAAGADEELIQRLDAPALQRRVQAALQRLRPRYRRALELRFFEGLDRVGCAARLELKLGTFDVLLLRALRAFKKEWEHERRSAEQA